MKSKYLVAAFSLVLLTGGVFAQNGSNQSSTSLGVDTVVVASDESHLDSTISDVPADTIGIPVVLTDPENLTSSTESVLSDVDRAVIVGGPAVISEDVRESIDEEVSQSTRVWGETASDTSLEVYDYFWPSNPESVNIVESSLYNEQETYQVLSAVVNDAENPVILADRNISTELVSELEDRQIEEATVYSTQVNESNETGNISEEDDNSSTTSLENRFSEADIEFTLNTGTPDELSTDLNEDLSQEGTVFATTGINSSYGIPSYAHPNAVTFPVTQDERTRDISFLNTSDFETVNVIGEQDAGQSIIDQLDSNQSNLITVNDTAETSITILRNQSNEWMDRANQELIGELEFEEMENMTNETENGNTTADNTTNMTDTEENSSGTGNTTGEVNNQSSITLNSRDNEIVSEAAYSDGQNYMKSTTITQDQSAIQFTYELTTSENQTSTGEEYSFQQRFSPDPGNYETTATLIVDGETIRETTENITIT